jgi:hypothetical protein
MDERECALLMRYTLELMRRAEMGDLVERIVAEAPHEAPPSRQLLRMLDALDDELRHQDAGTTRRIMGQLAETVHTPEGEPPRGLWLDLAPAHQTLFGLDGVNLAEGASLEAVIDDLESLRAQIRAELEGQQWR